MLNVSEATVPTEELDLQQVSVLQQVGGCRPGFPGCSQLQQPGAQRVGGQAGLGAAASVSCGSQPCPEQTPQGGCAGRLLWSWALWRAPRLQGQEEGPFRSCPAGQGAGLEVSQPGIRGEPARDRQPSGERQRGLSSSRPRKLGISLNVLKCPLGLLESLASLRRCEKFSRVPVTLI